METSLPAAFSEMREAEQLVDVHLVFDGTRVPCHKVILAGTCEYFKRMFLTNMSESVATEVSMKGISLTTGPLIIDYLYSKKTEITVDNAQGLLEASGILMLDKLKQKVEKFLLEKIEVENCLPLLNLGRLYELKLLVEASRKFLSDHLDEAIDTVEMKELREEDLVHILRNHASQETCFCMLQKWVRCTDGKAEQFTELLHHVQLSECSKQFITSTVLGEEMMASAQGLQIIQRTLQTSQQFNQNKSLAIGDFEGNFWVRAESADKEDWKLIERCSRFTSDYYSACASPEGIIFSGRDREGKAKNQCFLFCAMEREWSILPPMIKARYYHASIYHNSHLYIFGGRFTETSYTASVEALNMKTLEWSQLSPLPLALTNCHAVCASNKLFVLGGTDSSCTSSRGVHHYDSALNTWRSCTPTPEGCLDGSATSFHDRVFVVGGRSKSCMVYDPRVDSWTMLQRPQMEHMWGVSLEWNEKIVILGGEVDSIEEYCPESDQWSKWDLKMPTKNLMCFALKI
ncbi:hypothetical protein CAPTEDRAFT_137808 [Capitella teleta]|uniref:BTB domain-containing protein n=1 Tax=Capitella teleta TaxID=283909 RepID=R7V4C7_CAPTE|nr:hypothetical protein CAPTEDRAFT_137808 [Capitella teleta]|eukprot:ELU11196.1 hypothetical protein CAPTEDRAFT_137808 [Capitella teleta]